MASNLALKQLRGFLSWVCSFLLLHLMHKYLEQKQNSVPTSITHMITHIIVQVYRYIMIRTFYHFLENWENLCKKWGNKRYCPSMLLLGCKPKGLNHSSSRSWRPTKFLTVYEKSVRSKFVSWRKL